MTEVLVKTFGDYYPIRSSTQLRGPADMMAAAIWQKQFPIEFYDNPEKLKKFGRICSEALVEIAKNVNDIASKAKFKGFVNNFCIYTEEACQNLSYECLCIYICVEDIKDAYKKTEAIEKVFKIL